MADKTIGQLTETVVPSVTDYIPIFDATVTPTKKVSLNTIKNFLDQATTGWLLSSGWFYVTSGTFAVAGDFTALFPSGTKLKLTQTTVKYFYVTSCSYSAPNTYVNITGGSDYSLTNAVITSPYYSYASNPQGFPPFFNYTPVWTATVSAPSLGNGTISGLFSINGRLATIYITQVMGSTTSFGSGIYNWSLPFASNYHLTGSAFELDNGVAYYTGVTMGGGTTSSLSVISHAGGSNWSNTVPQTWAVSDQFRLTYFCYI